MSKQQWVLLKIAPEELEEIFWALREDVRQMENLRQDITHTKGALEAIEDVRRNYFAKEVPPTVEAREPVWIAIQDLVLQLEEWKKLKTVLGLRSLAKNVQGQLKALLFVEGKCEKVDT